jgi:DNA-binding NarL/FixJ family response regulator
MTVVNFDPIRNNDDLPEEDSTPAAGIRVILADSQAIYRVGMKKVFALEDDIRVVAQVETLQNLYAALQRYPTDVVLLEGQLISGTIDAIPELVRQAPEAKLIVQVTESDESNTVELYRRGVRGVVPRSISPDLLVKCVRKIAEGETWIDNQSISWVIEAYRSQATSLTDPKVQPKLSKKELAIISCITRAIKRSPTRSAPPSRSSRTICARSTTNSASPTAWSSLFIVSITSCSKSIWLTPKGRCFPTQNPRNPSAPRCSSLPLPQFALDIAVAVAVASHFSTATEPTSS